MVFSLDKHPGERESGDSDVATGMNLVLQSVHADRNNILDNLFGSDNEPYSSKCTQ